MNRLTFSHLAALEPELFTLEDMARHHAARLEGLPSRNRRLTWHSVLQPAISRKVGLLSDSDNPAVRSGAAYQVALAHIRGIFEGRAGNG